MRYLAAFGFHASHQLTQLTAPLGEVKAGVFEFGANHRSLALALKQPPVLRRHPRLQCEDREGRAILIGESSRSAQHERSVTDAMQLDRNVLLLSFLA